MVKNIRNIVIILLLAAAVWKLPGGGAAASTVSNALTLAFVGGLLWFGFRVYKENRQTIEWLGDRLRLILYGSVVLAAFTLIATSRLWHTTGGTVAWFVMIAIAVYGVAMAFRASRSY